MKKIDYQCDFCKVGGFRNENMASLTLVAAENFFKHNGMKGFFVSPMEWDLCPVCFERITDFIKSQFPDQAKGGEGK